MAKKKTHQEFLNDVLIKLGQDYEVLSEYPGAHGKVSMKHLICRNTFDKNVHDIMTKGSGCPYCNGARPALYNEQWVIKNTPLPYHYISGYTAMKEKCLFHCDKCGIDFYQLPSRLINQHLYGCNCCPTKKKTHEDFLKDLGKECLQEYEVLDTYINIDTKITFKHIPCGCTFQLEPEKFLHRYYKKYCPICYYKKSKGEILIETYLINNNIPHIREMSFLELPGKKFDFFLPEQNTIIEFDGIQHFQAIQHFGGEENFKYTQNSDKEKNQFCLKNKISLYRIPYTEIENVAFILNKILKEKSSTTIEKFLVKE